MSPLRRALAATVAAVLVLLGVVLGGVVGVVGGVVSAAPAAAATGVTDPLDGPYQEVHGEEVTDLPATPSCVDTVTTNFPFKDTAYGGDLPFTGNYQDSCGSGPWSRVVLTMSVTVQTGTQFDRIGDVLIGGVELLHLTTAEGESGSTSWSIQRDVTEDASVFTRPQPTYFIIGNQTDDTYTGIFYGTLSLSFYNGPTPSTTPDAVVPITGPLNRGTPTTTGPDVPITTAATIPANTTALTAEVFASGHGAEEEDWWDAPFACATGGIPYREVAIDIDGKLAGTAPVYPTIYTGGYGPDFWRPFPSPRAYNLRPYDFDLSPFIGQLTDGAAHSYSIHTIGQGGCVGYWFLSGNLLVTTNKASAGRTTGSVTSYTGDALPTNTTLGTQAAVSDVTTSKHALDIVGTVQPAGAAPTTVEVVQTLSSNATVAALDVLASWTWDSSTKRTTGAVSTTDSQDSTYGLDRDGAHWLLTDDQTTAGPTLGTTSLADTMNTVGSVEGITGVGNASTESWRYTAADGSCVDHELVAAAQNVAVDTSTACGDATSPPASLPEAPLALLLPVAGFAAIAVRRRRRR